MCAFLTTLNIIVDSNDSSPFMFFQLLHSGALVILTMIQAFIGTDT